MGEARPTMHHRISLNTFTTRHAPLDDDLALCRELGIRQLGLVSGKYAADPAGARARCAAAGIDVAFLSTSLGDLVLVGRDAAAGGAALLTQLRPAIDAAATLAAPLLCLPSGATAGGTPTDRAIDALVAALPPARAYAARSGVRLAVENSSAATRDYGFIQSIADAARLAEAGGISICMELQNCWAEGGLAPLVKANAHRIGVVQVSDFTIGDDPRMNRRVPGDGDVPLERLIGMLLDSGYRGLFDIELVGPCIDAEGAVSAVRRSAAWLTELLTRLGA